MLTKQAYVLVEYKEGIHRREKKIIKRNLSLIKFNASSWSNLLPFQKDFKNRLNLEIDFIQLLSGPFEMETGTWSLLCIARIVWIPHQLTIR